MVYRPGQEEEGASSRLPSRRGPKEETEGGEERDPEFRTDLRRKSWVSPWSEAFEEERPREESRPISVPESLVPELYEILVPEQPKSPYMTLFEELPYRPLPRRGAAPRREERGAEGREWGPEAPRAQRPGPAAGPGPRARARTGPPTLDPGLWFDMNAVWNGVRQRRADQRFQRGTPVGVVQISPPRPDEASRAQDLLRFFKVPKGQVEKLPGKAIWDMLHEFMDELSYSMNQMKPNDIPGEVGFQAGRDGSFWLGYME